MWVSLISLIVTGYDMGVDMALFADRERAFEAKFAYDEEANFRIEMKRDKIVGRWAAGILGLSEDEVENYIRSVIHVDLQSIDEEDLFFKIKADFDKKAIGQSDAGLLLVLEKAMEQAVASIK